MKEDFKKVTMAQKLVMNDIQDDHPLEVIKEDPNEKIVVDKKEKKEKTKRIVLRSENLKNTDTGIYKLLKNPPNNFHKKKIIKEIEKITEDGVEKIKQEEIVDGQEKDEVEYVRDLLLNVKQWSSEMMPRYDFEYLLERIQALGKKQDMVNMMENLRNVHLYLQEKEQNPHGEIAMGKNLEEEYLKEFSTDQNRLIQYTDLDPEKFKNQPVTQEVRKLNENTVRVPYVLKNNKPIELNQLEQLNYGQIF